MNIRIIKCLIKKDFKNCFLNKNILLMMIVPIFFCFIYKNITQDPTYVLWLCAMFSISIIPTTVLPMMVAEEKEKNTLRSLMLANVTAFEFLFSKAFVCVLLTLVDALIVFFIMKTDTTLLPIYTGSIILSTTSLLLLGAVAGLFSKDQASAGTIATPLMLIVMMPSVFSGLSEFMEKVSILVPTTSFRTLLFSQIDGLPFLSYENIIAVIVCLVWLVIGWILFKIMFKRFGFDK